MKTDMWEKEVKTLKEEVRNLLVSNHCKEKGNFIEEPSVTVS